MTGVWRARGTMWAQRPTAQRERRRETTMPAIPSSDRVNQMLKHASGMAAAAGAYRAVQVLWTRLSGAEPPPGPDDPDVALGRAIVWTLVMGAVITTARMIAIRYTSRLLHGHQQSVTEKASEVLADHPDSSAT